MDGMLDEFRQVAEGLTFHPPVIPVITTGDLQTPEFWVRHVREAVRFADGMKALEQAGVTTFVELGPDGVLSAMGQACVEDGEFLPVLRAGRDEPGTAVTALAGLHVRGVAVDWAAFFAGTGAVRVDLPTYAFQRKRYWPIAQPPVADAGQVDPVDARFWEAVEREDLESLAGTLEVDGEAPLSQVLPVLSSWRRHRRQRSTVDQWRYRVTWKPLTVPTGATLDGTWLLILPAGQAAHPAVAAVTGALTSAGATVTPVELDPASTEPAMVTARLRAARPAEQPVIGVFSLLALDMSPHPAHHGLPTGLALTALLDQAEVEAPLWLATHDGVRTGHHDTSVRPDQALIWGLGRVSGLDQPRRWGGLIDLPEVLDEGAQSRLAGILADPHGEDQTALRPSGVLGRRLVRAAADETAPGTWRPRGTVIVTGGTGALGAEVARWLARNGADEIVLTSRRGAAAPGATELETELTGLGAKVVLAACDVADRDQVATLLGRIEENGTRVRAVVHTAGVAGSATAGLGGLADVLAAKTGGAAHLDHLLGDRELDAFVLFSSIAGVWGSGGEGAYAAANAYLDALAQRRRAQGRTATAIAWGPWAEAGMAAGEGVGDHLRRRGLPALAPALAVDALERALGGDETCLVVADVDWARFAPSFTAARHRPLIGDLPEVRRALNPEAEPAEPGVPAAVPAFLERIGGLTPAERDRAVLDLIRSTAADVLGHDGPAAVEPARGFLAIGFDSLTAVELRNRLTAATGLRLPTTLIFDYPTPDALAGHLRTVLAPPAADGVTPALAEVDRLESRLTDLTVGAGERDQITERLQALLARFSGSTVLLGGDDEPDALESATADEVFDIIHREFGRS
jgi:NAD(P)-dependent dehydrogenase (short-subunit alcohol dehydrogenase family)/acyl carrier protein